MSGPINNLTDVYVLELKDLYNANKQANAVTEKFIEATNNAELKKALQRSVEGTKKGNEHIEKIAEAHGFKPTGHKCKGMEGLVSEAKEHVLNQEFGDEDARDAMMISQYQRMAHYAITGYGCAEAFAKRLGHSSDAEALKKCKEQTKDGDLTFTEIAEGGVNKDAMAA